MNRRDRAGPCRQMDVDRQRNQPSHRPPEGTVTIDEAARALVVVRRPGRAAVREPVTDGTERVTRKRASLPFSPQATAAEQRVARARRRGRSLKRRVGRARNLSACCRQDETAPTHRCTNQGACRLLATLLAGCCCACVLAGTGTATVPNDGQGPREGRGGEGSAALSHRR